MTFPCCGYCVKSSGKKLVLIHGHNPVISVFTVCMVGGGPPSSESEHAKTSHFKCFDHFKLCLMGTRCQYPGCLSPLYVLYVGNNDWPPVRTRVRCERRADQLLPYVSELGTLLISVALPTPPPAISFFSSGALSLLYSTRYATCKFEYGLANRVLHPQEKDLG